MALTIQTILSTKPQNHTKKPQPPYRLSQVQRIKAANEVDDSNLESVLNSISVQSDELLLGEEMWKKRAQQKYLSNNCLSVIGRSKSVETTFPTVEQARNWSVEKEFWLSNIPRQQRIWEYNAQDGSGSWEYWGPVKKRPGEDDFLEDLQTDPRTGLKITFAQRCHRYERALEWEQSVIQGYDQRALDNSPKMGAKLGREKEIALAQTTARFRNYRKAIMGNLMDVQLETKQLDDSCFHTGRRFQVEQMHRLVEGYKNLKWVYDLNPDLVDSLAQQHLNGKSSSKQWMSLSRTEVKKVLKLLKKGSEDPNFCPRSYLAAAASSGRQSMPRPCPARLTMTGSAAAGASSSGRKCQNFQKNKGGVNIRGKNRGPRPLKPFQLMPLHVPGPDSLHQNVLIRPYTVDERERNMLTDKCGTSCVGKDDTKIAPPQINLPGEEDEEDEVGLTIESFAPFYRS